MAGIINNLLLLLAVLIGFYLGRFSEVNEKVGIKSRKLAKKLERKPKFFVEQPNEWNIEQQQIAKEEKKKLKEENELERS